MSVDLIARAIAISNDENQEEIRDLKEKIEVLENNFKNLNKILEKDGGILDYTPFVRFALAKKS